MSQKPKKPPETGVVIGALPFDEHLHASIAAKAYELHIQRGGVHGCDMEDWLEAERIILRNSSTGIRRDREPPAPKR